MELSITALALFASLWFNSAHADVVLSKKIMKLSKTAAKLSVQVYDVPLKCKKCKVFHKEPDQALVIKKRGYCFGVFRGTTNSWNDWSQNLKPGTTSVCTKSTTPSACCDTWHGYSEAYHAPYYKKFEKAIEKCAKSCVEKNECVIFTGHSQGGALASIAGLRMTHLNPRVITFGEPPTLGQSCAPITTQRWYRYVNSWKAPGVGAAYDPVPFSIAGDTEVYGNFIMLGEDETGTAFIGLDSTEQFGSFATAAAGAPSHSSLKYLDRITKLMSSSTNYPIRTDGFATLMSCSKDLECESNKCGKETFLSYKHCIGLECVTDKDCETNRCDSGLCLPKLGSCMACNENSDCIGDTCFLFHCSNAAGKMDDECICAQDTDCESGRCENWAPPSCLSTLGGGSSCNENSDCKSGSCNWWFQCETPKALYAITTGDHADTLVGISAVAAVFGIIVGFSIILGFVKTRGQSIREMTSPVEF